MTATLVSLFQTVDKVTRQYSKCIQDIFEKICQYDTMMVGVVSISQIFLLTNFLLASLSKDKLYYLHIVRDEIRLRFGGHIQFWPRNFHVKGF